jgi:hypothetical protein
VRQASLVSPVTNWIFVLVKQDGKWRVDVSAFGDTHHTLLP